MKKYVVDFVGTTDYVYHMIMLFKRLNWKTKTHSIPGAWVVTFPKEDEELFKFMNDDDRYEILMELPV